MKTATVWLFPFIVAPLMSGCILSPSSEDSKDGPRPLVVGGGSTQATQTTQATQPVIANEATRPLAFGAASAPRTQRIVFKELTTAFPNRGMGWLPYINDIFHPDWVDDTPLASAYFTNMITWADLQPGFNQFNWAPLGNLVRFAKSKGRKLRFALNSVDPTSSTMNRMQVPYWYIQLPGSGRWISTWYGQKISNTHNPYNGNAGWIFEPDYASSAYTTSYFRFLRALSDKWKSEPDWVDTIEAIEISNYGLWGEWHSEFPWTSPAVKETVLKGFVDWYFALLPGAAGSFAPFRTEISALFYQLGESGVNHAVQQGADMVRKCIGICNQGYIGYWDKVAIDSYRPWRSFRGEWGDWDGGGLEYFYANANSTVPVNDTKGAIDEGLYSYKVDYLGWFVGASLNKPGPNAGETLAEYFQKRAGYRLYLESAEYPGAVRPGQTFSVQHAWWQRGVSKLYFPAYFTMELKNETLGTSIPLGRDRFPATDWSLGPQGPHRLTSRFRVPDNLPPGNYKVLVGLVDSAGRPAINLASEGRVSPRTEGYSLYSAGTITVRP